MVFMTTEKANLESHALKKQSAPIRNVCLCGCALLAIFAGLYWMSSPYEYGSKLDRPNLIVVGLLGAASVVSFYALINAFKVPHPQRKTLLLLIVSFAISTRLIAIFTCPILEVDYYRYLWDGKVVAEGISPYLYSPERVIEGDSGDTGTLAELSELSLRSESNRTILSRIHFEDHTTIYPPVSQAVFAAVMKWLPDTVSVETHIVVMKSALVLFDLGTMLLVFFLLRTFALNVGWLIVIAWNPLVIKEIANGGHLDSIATFFMVLSVVLLARWRLSRSAKTEICFLIGSGIALALGFGAKLFPVILLPALMTFVGRKSWSQAILFSLLFAAVSMVVLWPMIHPIVGEYWPGESESALVENESPDQSDPFPSDTNDDEPTETVAKHGAVGFFSKWRINDSIFSAVYLNFKDSNRKIDRTPWFVFTSTTFRKQFDDWCRENSIGGQNPAFFVAKVSTLGVFLCFYGWQLIALYRRRFDTGDADRQDCLVLLRRSVSILVVFLFLQPTVNPWYLVWIVPLACFANNRGWLLVSGLLLTYYSRFWFRSLAGSFPFLGRNYSGVGIYDHIVVWVVMLIVLVTLAAFSRSDLLGREHSAGGDVK